MEVYGILSVSTFLPQSCVHRKERCLTILRTQISRSRKADLSVIWLHITFPHALRG